MKPLDEKARLYYIQWDDRFQNEKPFQIVSENIPDLTPARRSNITMVEGPEEIIEDVRGRESRFTLDDNGFAFFKRDFPRLDYQSIHDIENIYHAQVEELLKESVADVDEVRIFNWRLRENLGRFGSPSYASLNNPMQPLAPAYNVHIDQSAATAIAYVNEVMGEKADRYLKGRVRMFTVWRPYKDTVVDCPMALCDGSSIRKKDLLLCDNIQKSRVVENVLPVYSHTAKWYYLNRQSVNETLVIKIFDSKQGVKASCES